MQKLSLAGCGVALLTSLAALVVVALQLAGHPLTLDDRGVKRSQWEYSQLRVSLTIVRDQDSIRFVNEQAGWLGPGGEQYEAEDIKSLADKMMMKQYGNSHIAMLNALGEYGWELIDSHRESKSYGAPLVGSWAAYEYTLRRRK